MNYMFISSTILCAFIEPPGKSKILYMCSQILSILSNKADNDFKKQKKSLLNMNILAFLNFQFNKSNLGQFTLKHLYTILTAIGWNENRSFVINHISILFQDNDYL